jgi:hypothetical protein
MAPRTRTPSTSLLTALFGHEELDRRTLATASASDFDKDVSAYGDVGGEGFIYGGTGIASKANLTFSGIIPGRSSSTASTGSSLGTSERKPQAQETLDTRTDRVSARHHPEVRSRVVGSRP